MDARRATVVEVALSSPVWVAVLGLVTAFLSPGGAYLFIWPVLIGAPAILATRRWAADDWQAGRRGVHNA